MPMKLKVPKLKKNVYAYNFALKNKFLCILTP